MVIIDHTNIVVDAFSTGKDQKLNKFIYFLTHMHADHYVGLSNSWNFGKIYCSKITKTILLNMFPKIQNVEGLDLNTPHIIYLNKQQTKSVTVELFDANHCPGSTMILFTGYMGTILHTGDMRFHRDMIKNNPSLYPPTLYNSDEKACSIHVDKIIYDNTFCDPIFKFPTRTICVEQMIAIIEKNRPCHAVINIYNLGKEEILIKLAEKFQTSIVVNESRFNDIKSINLRPELFTTNPKEGWIYLSKAMPIEEIKKLYPKEKCIFLKPSGWANCGDSIQVGDESYLISYSSHSNFEEIERFVKSISPCVLEPIVEQKYGSEKINNIKEIGAYMCTLGFLKQRGPAFLEKTYTKARQLSIEYTTWQDEKKSLELNIELELIDPSKTETERAEENAILMRKQNQNIFHSGTWQKKKNDKFFPPINKNSVTIEECITSMSNPIKPMNSSFYNHDSDISDLHSGRQISSSTGSLLTQTRNNTHFSSINKDRKKKEIKQNSNFQKKPSFAGIKNPKEIQNTIPQLAIPQNNKIMPVIEKSNPVKEKTSPGNAMESNNDSLNFIQNNNKKVKINTKVELSTEQKDLLTPKLLECFNNFLECNE